MAPASGLELTRAGSVTACAGNALAASALAESPLLLDPHPAARESARTAVNLIFERIMIMDHATPAQVARLRVIFSRAGAEPRGEAPVSRASGVMSSGGSRAHSPRWTNRMAAMKIRSLMTTRRRGNCATLP